MWSQVKNVQYIKVQWTKERQSTVLWKKMSSVQSAHWNHHAESMKESA